MAEEQLRALLQAMLDGSEDLVDGCRRLASLHNGGDTRVPIIFVGFDSELDGVPLTEHRHQWEPQALAEAMKRVELYRANIVAEVKKLLESLS